MEKFKEAKHWIFEKMNKIFNPLAGLIKTKRENTMINIKKREDITINYGGIERILKIHC